MFFGAGRVEKAAHTAGVLPAKLPQWRIIMKIPVKHFTGIQVQDGYNSYSLIFCPRACGNPATRFVIFDFIPNESCPFCSLLHRSVLSAGGQSYPGVIDQGGC
jgi:hypothetical protein